LANNGGVIDVARKTQRLASDLPLHPLQEIKVVDAHADSVAKISSVALMIR
jgi:hypothetical protein